MWQERCYFLLTFSLDRGLNRGLDKLLVDLGADIRIASSGSTTVKGKQSRDIELGGLEDLGLADVGVLQRVDVLAGLLDADSDGVLGAARGRAGELGDKLLKVARDRFLSHDIEHLAADLADLRALSVGGLLDLVATARSEGNAEQTDEVTVGGLDIDESLDQRLPLLDHRAELVRGHVHTVEVGQAVLALDLVHLELNLAESTGLVLGQIAEGDLDNTAVEGVGSLVYYDDKSSVTYDVFSYRYLRRPWVRLTRVLPTWRTSNMEGALRSYQSLRVKGSTLMNERMNNLHFCLGPLCLALTPSSSSPSFLC